MFSDYIKVVCWINTFTLKVERFDNIMKRNNTNFRLINLKLEKRTQTSDAQRVIGRWKGLHSRFG